MQLLAIPRNAVVGVELTDCNAFVREVPVRTFVFWRVVIYARYETVRRIITILKASVHQYPWHISCMSC